jgi:hypothetical protein
MGKVGLEVAQKIELADKGLLGSALPFKFNVRISRIKKVAGGTEADYQQVYVLNGFVRFKRYNLLDRVLYAIAQLFPRGRNGTRS